MKILQIIPSLIKGGAERLVLDITRALQSTPGIEVRLVYFNDINDYPKEYSDISSQLLDISVVPSVFGKWSVNMNAWEQLLDEFEPDIIHSHLFAADLVSRFSIRPGITYFSHFHDNMHQLRSFASDPMLSKRRLTDLYERNVVINMYRKSKNTFLSISHDTTTYFRSNLPKDLSDSIVDFPNAIDFEKFAQFQANAPESSSALKILNVGAFVPKKNQSFLVEIAKELHQRNVEFEIRFAGDGPNIELVKNKASEYGLTNQIKFLGNVENIEKEMHSSNIYVHTANYEPFGLVLIEAMAAGLPVVSLNGRGNSELIANGENGFLLDHEDVSTFVNRIIDLSQNTSMWKSFSSKGKTFAKQFDIASYVDRLLDLYRIQSDSKHLA